jgi:23S rRNA pseudouridine1911/1915/1917 synthase
VQRVIRGDCWVDGRAAKPSLTVVPGQVVTFRRPAPVEPDAPRELPILHTDELFYALDKPAGIAMHPTAKFHFSTVTAVLREKFPGEQLQITHRLDLETSGVLLIARTRDAAVAMKRAFAKRKVQKKYLAIVEGILEGEGLIDQPLALAGGLVRVKMGVRAEGLPSRTRWRAVLHKRASPGMSQKNHTLVECFPETGRQHQIRAHLDWLGHPIVGDKLYPDERIFADYQDHGWVAVAERLSLSRHALHAAWIRFPHPLTGEPVEIASELPSDLKRLIE